MSIAEQRHVSTEAFVISWLGPPCRSRPIFCRRLWALDRQRTPALLALSKGFLRRVLDPVADRSGSPALGCEGSQTSSAGSRRNCENAAWSHQTFSS